MVRSSGRGSGRDTDDALNAIELIFGRQFLPNIHTLPVPSRTICVSVG